MIQEVAMSSVSYRLACKILDHSSGAKPCEWRSPVLKYREHGTRMYQLEEEYWCQTLVIGCAAVMRIGDRIVGTLDQNGGVRIYPGFIWDGPSGPTYDTKDSMAGSLVHDFLYRLARQHKIGPDFRDECDETARKIWLQDGMYGWRANMWFKALRVGAKWAYTGSDDAIVSLSAK